MTDSRGEAIEVGAQALLPGWSMPESYKRNGAAAVLDAAYKEGHIIYQDEWEPLLFTDDPQALASVVFVRRVAEGEN